jgi:hypothetical protein
LFESLDVKKNCLCSGDSCKLGDWVCDVIGKRGTAVDMWLGCNVDVITVGKNQKLNTVYHLCTPVVCTGKPCTSKLAI